MLNPNQQLIVSAVSPSAAGSRPRATTLGCLSCRDAYQVLRGRSRSIERNYELTCIILSKNQQLQTIIQDGLRPLDQPSIGIRMHNGVESLAWKQSICVTLDCGRPSSTFRRESTTHWTAAARLGCTASDFSTGLYTALR